MLDVIKNKDVSTGWTMTEELKQRLLELYQIGEEEQAERGNADMTLMFIDGFIEGVAVYDKTAAQEMYNLLDDLRESE